MIANNDESAIGAIQAMKAANVDMKSVVVGGVDATQDALAAMQAGDLDVTVFQDAAGQGAGALDAALKLAKGEAVEQKVYMPFQLVTPANIDDFISRRTEAVGNGSGIRRFRCAVPEYRRREQRRSWRRISPLTRGGRHGDRLSHGVGGLTFDAKKRAWPPEFSVFLALIVISIVFEVLAGSDRRAASCSTPATTSTACSTSSGLRSSSCRSSIVGIIAIGVTQVIITGGIDLSSGSVVGATAMIAMSFAQVAMVNGNPNPKAMFGDWAGLDLPVIVPVLVGARLRPVRRPGQRRADRLHANPAVHRHARHDGDGARHRQMVVQGQADLVSRPRVSPRSARA